MTIFHASQMFFLSLFHVQTDDLTEYSKDLTWISVLQDHFQNGKINNLVVVHCGKMRNESLRHAIELDDWEYVTLQRFETLT